MGFCSGIENYFVTYPGDPLAPDPIHCSTFSEDYLLVIDESHATVPQIGGMYAATVHERPCWWIMDSAYQVLDNRPFQL